MEYKEYKLNRETANFQFRTTIFDIKVYSDNIDQPIVLYKGDVNIKNHGFHVSISDAFETKEVNKGFRGGNTVIIHSSSVISRNGITIVNGREISEEEKGNIELIIPRKPKEYSIFADSINSDISIDNLKLFRLVLDTVNGNVSLKNFDSLYSVINTVSGDVDIEVLESKLNYEVNADTLSGDIIQRSEEKTSPRLLDYRHTLDIETTSGDIKVLFKGKY